MTGILENIHLVMPEIVILVTACVTLLADLFLSHRCRAISFYLAAVGLVIAGLSSGLLFGQYHSILFSGLIISDDVGSLMKLFIALCVLLSFVYSKHYLSERQMPEGDYYVLGLFSALGMMTLVSSHSLLTVYLGLELMSLPLYAMAAIRRSNGDSSEAAMKYFVMGAIASGMLLYGISLVYGVTGKLELQEIANLLAQKQLSHDTLMAFALVFIVAGIGFKVAAVPFHMWAPDVYQGSPTSVTLFLSAAPKIAAVGMAIRILSIGLVDITPQWQQLVLVMALLSTALGNLLAIVQTNIKRLFAYSAISHMGYALFGILAATTAGYAAATYYVLVYGLMSVAAFGLLVLMSNAGAEIEEISDLKGLNRRNPWLAFMMMIVLFSMAGVPPTVGFFTKLLVLKALVDVHMLWVATLGLIFAVIGAFYYLRVIKVMYFDEAAEQAPVAMSYVAKLVFSVNCLALLGLGMFPGALVSTCMSAFS